MSSIAPSSSSPCRRTIVRHVWKSSARPTAPGREGFKRFLAEVLFVGFPDLRWEIEEQIAEGEKLVSRFTWYGTHEGAFLGLPPTGKRVAVRGVVIDRVVGGRWTESRILMDNLGMMQHLGAIPPPPAEASWPGSEGPTPTFLCVRGGSWRSR